MAEDRPLRPADPALFYARRDANDVRLGETVGREARDYKGADVVLLGVPQDEGIRRNGGRLGAAQGPAEIRRALYRLTVNGVERLKLHDAGDLAIQPELEETHSALQKVVGRMVLDGKRLVVLGGGNDISYPDCSALSMTVGGEVLAFNVDAHFDVRADAQPNSGTPYRQLLEEGYLKPNLFHELGSQPQVNSPVYAQYLAERRVRVTTMDQLRANGVVETVRGLLRAAPKVDAIFWGFDLDVVSAADAPGVSAPNPCGMRAEELCAIAALAGADPRTRIVEFTEVSPSYDIDHRTSRLTAAAIHSYLRAIE